MKKGGGVTGLSLFSVMQVIGGGSRRRAESLRERWRLEAEGETETLETKVVSNGVEGVHVDPNGEGRHEREQVKKSRRQSEAPGEAGEDIKSPKRKRIRVESEETQGYVREANDMDQEEDENKFCTERDQRSANAVVSL